MRTGAFPGTIYVVRSSGGYRGDQVERKIEQGVPRGYIFALWFPLALSVTLMMLEGPAVQGAIARLGTPALSLAAFGFVLSIQLILQSPVIMLVSTAIALATD